MAVPAGHSSLSPVKPMATVFELEALEGLPCGCVAAAYRARPWDVAVVSLEAKGPHCILAGHASGQILRLGDPSEFDEDDEEDDGRIGPFFGLLSRPAHHYNRTLGLPFASGTHATQCGPLASLRTVGVPARRSCVLPCGILLQPSMHPPEFPQDLDCV